MLSGISPALARLWDVLSRIPPMWLVTLGLALYSCVTAARKKQWRDASIMSTMVFAAVMCVIYLCMAGNVL